MFHCLTRHQESSEVAESIYRPNEPQLGKPTGELGPEQTVESDQTAAPFMYDGDGTSQSCSS